MSRPPSGLKPVNRLSLGRNNASISDTYIIDPSMSISPTMMKRFPDGKEPRENFKVCVEGGDIDVDLWLVERDDLPPASDGITSKEAKVVISLRTDVNYTAKSTGSHVHVLIARIHRPNSTSPRLHLKAHSQVTKGRIEIHLPRSFQGLVAVLGSDNRMSFETSVAADVTPLNEAFNSMLYSIGDLSVDESDMDMLEITGLQASIFVTHVADRSDAEKYVRKKRIL